MVVSHYLISALELTGQIIGGAGLVYATSGVFGEKGTATLRAIPRFVALMLYYIIGGVGVMNVMFRGSNRPDEGILVLLLALYALVPALSYTVMPTEFLTSVTTGLKSVTSADFWLRVIVGYIGWLIFYFLMLRNSWSFWSFFLELFCWGPAFGLLIIAGVLIGGRALYRSTNSLDARRLTILGLFLSLLGMVPQSIPQVLDLLNIPIR